MSDFIGVQSSNRVWCISCGEEQFGDETIAQVAESGAQGTLKAIYAGSEEHDSRPCVGCDTPMNEQEAIRQIFTSLAFSIDEIMSGPAYPINDEYCWMHSGLGLGGWTCQHPDCKQR